MSRDWVRTVNNFKQLVMVIKILWQKPLAIIPINSEWNRFNVQASTKNKVDSGEEGLLFQNHEND